MKRRWFALTLIALGCAVPALAIFGIGDIVFDPSNLEEAVQQLATLEQQYVQLVQTYNTIQSQYQQMIWMAQRVPVDMVARYRALTTPWTLPSATNTYGTTGGWMMAVDSGLDASNGYSLATETLRAYGPAFGNIPGDQQDRIKTNYATVELTDGANLAAIQTLGQLRSNAPGVETAIQNLESDSLSADPDMNTELAVLNKINAADIINVRNTQDANKLLVALTEQQILQAKRDRDAEARAFNQHIQFMSEGQAAMASQAANASSAMLAWRMP